MKTYTGSWKSDRAEQKFRVADAARWEQATDAPPVAIDVTTRFGSTRVHRWPGDGADIVLLHGVGDTSFRWITYAEPLADCNVFAIDIMGDVGNSTHDVGFETVDDFGIWLSETIDSLGLTAPHIAGMSLGGYVALSHAVQGGPAASLVLFDPVGLIELRLFRFIRWGAATGLAALAPRPIRQWAGRRLRQPVLDDKADVRAHMKGSMGHPMKLPPLPVFTDEQLASIAVPVRVVAGAKSPPFDGEAMIQRATRAFKNASTRLLPDAGHALAITHHDVCVAELRAAVDAEPSGRQ